MHMNESARPPSGLLLAWRQLWRDWRSGDLRILTLAVVLAVAAVTSVGFLSDRMERGLKRDAAALLGGDALVASDRPSPAGVKALATELRLAQMETANFPSMVRADELHGSGTALVAVKAVSSSYPLRGQLLMADGSRQGAPTPGEAWADAAVLDTLGLKTGDSLWLGRKSLRVAGVIAIEPDRGAGFLNIAPRLMVHLQDLPETGLIQAASRVTYRLAVADKGDGAAVQRFVSGVESLISTQGLRGVRLESLDNARPEMRQTQDRAARFLRLVAMLAALLAAVAVGLAARDYASRHLDSCAMLRVLGVSQPLIARTYAFAFLGAGLASSAVGIVLGFGLHQIFLLMLAGLVPVDLPMAGAMPVMSGFALGLSLLLGFGLAPVLQLATVPALRVIRRDLGPTRLASVLMLVGGLLGFAAMLVLIAGDWRLGVITAGGFALALLLFAALAWLALALLRRVVSPHTAPAWLLLATRQLSARPGMAAVQIASLGVGMLALCLLIMLRTDLVQSWRAATPANAPDRFVINVQPEQSADFRASLDAAGVKGYDWFPMIRGRLVAINGAAVNAKAFGDERARALVEREFNLSHSAELPSHNQLVQGRWVPEEPDALSVEQGLAQQLGLRLGDRLRFDVAGQFFEGRVANLRKVDWASMRVNFYVMLPRAEFADVPRSFITAFRSPSSPQAARALDKALVQQFPNITSIDVSAQLAQLHTVLDQVAQAVQLLFGFSLLVGLLVLLASVGASRNARAREFALMRAMGASGRLLAKVQRAELLGTGALAGLLAGSMALLLGAALAHYVFDFSWGLKLWVPAGGLLTGAVLAQLAGWWALRGILTRPVTQSLREADAS